jgi:hypothetical protein
MQTCFTSIDIYSNINQDNVTYDNNDMQQAIVNMKEVSLYIIIYLLRRNIIYFYFLM